MKDILIGLLVGFIVMGVALTSIKFANLSKQLTRIEQALAERISGPTTIHVEKGTIYLTLPEGKFELTANSIGLVEMYDPKKKGGK